MRRLPHPSPFDVARVALSVAALLAQGTLLPLAHAGHELPACSAGVAGVARPGTEGAGTTAVQGAAATLPAHDATSCALCLALSHGRTVTVAVATDGLALQTAVERPRVEIAVWPRTPASAAARSRAPPPLTA